MYFLDYLTWMLDADFFYKIKERSLKLKLKKEEKEEWYWIILNMNTGTHFLNLIDLKSVNSIITLISW